jgi:cell division protein FtsZ
MKKSNANIKIIGVGGAGCNAVNYMIEEHIEDVEFYGLNTDLQALQETDIQNKIQIGKKRTNGLGAGAEPSVGRESAEEDAETIKHILEGTDMVFITSGMGGGTGTGAAPVIAKYAKEMGILTVGVVTKPFSFENRSEQAEQGILELQEHIDSLIVIPNDKLLKTLGKGVGAMTAFMESNKVLLNAVKGIAELITKPGIINVDFADVKRVMNNSGTSMMGMGIASGENRVQEALSQALNSELLEASTIRGAKGILVNVCGNMDLPLSEFEEVGNIVRQHTNNKTGDLKIIAGMSISHEISDSLVITIVATNLFPDEELSPYDELNNFNELENEVGVFSLPESNDEKNIEPPIEQNDNQHSIQKEAPKQEDDSWDIPSFLVRKG